ncbi:MAG: alanine racemase [Candidatus Obscuribacterales bacterium]|nr:alanine racemase [Candidatus Obscuribacterales bacterium]
MVTHRQQAASSVRRDAWVEIDLSAIEKNLSVIKNWMGKDQPPPQIMAVVKSDAYGHGAVQVAEVLLASGATWLAVASVDEGSQIREIDSSAPILILSPSPFWALGTAISDSLDLTVTSIAEIEAIADVARKLHMCARVHLKVDTGMHRIGCPPEKAKELVELIESLPELDLRSIYSHLAIADNEESVRFQNNIFSSVLDDIDYKSRKNGEGTRLFAHLASSDAAHLFPFSRHDLVRAGLNLYGLESTRNSKTLTPALALRGRINHIRDIKEGESVGYGLTWTAKRQTRLGNIPIGYADGVDRKLSNRLQGLLSGKLINQVGRISMDQMLFDITDVPEAQEGDVITLIGEENGLRIGLSDWALILDTITYELACRLRVRLPRIYTRRRNGQ